MDPVTSKEKFAELVMHLESAATNYGFSATALTADRLNKAREAVMQAYSPHEPEAAPSDDFIRTLWRDNGGSFHGPKVETGTMPEANLLRLFRNLLTGLAAVREAERRITPPPGVIQLEGECPSCRQWVVLRTDTDEVHSLPVVRCACGAHEWPPNSVQIEDSRGRLHTLNGCQPGATATKEVKP